MSDSTMTGIERPTGVTILAILSVLGGILGVLLFEYYTFLDIIGLILSIVQLAVGWGLWTLKEWAHPLALILAIVSIILAPINAFVIAAMVPYITFGLLLPGIIVGWAIQGIIIYYLTRPEIKDVFGVTQLFKF